MSREAHLRFCESAGVCPLRATHPAKAVRQWLSKMGIRTLFIEPGCPWENGYCESFNGKLRDELLDREIFYTLLEAKVLIERWRQHDNRVRPHSSLRGDRIAAQHLRARPA